MNIHIETINHKDQRYDTAGDWFFDLSGDLYIKVSDTTNWKYNALIALHELIEVLLCKDRIITTEEVDAFDINYENNRKDGDMSEPGDDRNAPYFKEHQIATVIERLIANELKVDWETYDKEVLSM